MNGSRVRTLPGMRDVRGELQKSLGQAAESFRLCLSDGGYEEIDTPLLEDAELFVRKSGGELTSRLYTFSDPGGRRVSLRPEFTSSVIRHFIEESDRVSLPVRWRYSGPVFRYEPGNGAPYRQFNQLGAELIGAGGVEADAEVLSTACAGLRRAGVGGFGLRIGHLGVLSEALDIHGVSERAKLFIVSNVRALKSGATDLARLIRQAGEVGLLRAGAGQPADGVDVDGSRGLIKEVLTGAMSGPAGRRTPEEIVDRLLRKIRQADDPDDLERAMGVVSDLAGVEGAPVEALERAGGIFEAAGGRGTSLGEIGGLVASLKESGVAESQITLDFGLARGLAYYTGVIFEATGDVAYGSGPLCGGGRYDGLVRSLGGEDVPAAGFAYTLDRVVDELRGEGAAGRSVAGSPAPE